MAIFKTGQIIFIIPSGSIYLVSELQGVFLTYCISNTYQ